MNTSRFRYFLGMMVPLICLPGIAMAGPPSISTQPTNQTVAVDGTALFSVVANGTHPLSYQWNFNSTNKLVGMTNASLTITNAQTTNAGTYAVTVSNQLGSVTSSNAVLTVVSNPSPVVCDEADLQAAVAAGGTITFGCDGVITLTNTLVVTRRTTIDGTGHAVTLSGGNAVRLFYVAPGVTFSVTNLALANGSCLVTNGAAGTPADAGAIYNDGGTVTLFSCTLTNNSAQSLIGSLARGGAIFNNGGTVSLSQSTLLNNTASYTILGIGLGGSHFQYQWMGDDHGM